MLRNIDISTEKASGSSDEKVIDETPGELTIYVYFPRWAGFYDWMIAAFNEQYPNVRVSVKTQMENNTMLSEYSAKLSVDLMSGSAGDIIEVGEMPYIQYTKNNLLEDLYPYMESDPEFHPEDYYTNFLEAMEYKDKLYVMPMSFFYKCVRFNKTLLEENHIEAPEGDSVNYKEISDIYHKIAPNNNKLVISRFWGQYILEDIENIRYLDEEQSRADFNSQEFMDFLNEMKSIRWPSEEELRLSQFNFAGEDYWDRTDENDLCLIVASFYHMERNAKLFYEHPSNLTIPIPLSASNGDKEFTCPDKDLAISSSSKNKNLAWKFIRFCIEEKPLEVLKDDNLWPITGMPINRNNTLKLLKAAFGEDNEEAVEMVDRWNWERNSEGFITCRGVLDEAIRGTLREFYEGRLTAEECARQVQERAEIYLKE
jgi:ABC-type glycerol-3-phosphate transport system substrate-binding protein